MRLNLTNKIFLAIFLLALILRFYKLGNIPPSLDWDENSNAYNAYSILKTGKDEYRNKFPLYNRSFNDYKPPLYMYLSVPVVAVFGLTPFSARFVSAICGLLTIVTLFFLIKKLFKNNQKADMIALSSAFLITIAPWTIMFSRIGLEANLGLFIVTLAIALFLYGLENKYLLLSSALFFGLSLYAYHAERIFSPVMILALVFIFRKEFLKIEKKIIIIFSLIFIIFAVPLFVFMPKEALLQRFNISSSDFIKENLAKSSLLQLQDEQQGFGLLKVLHNRRITLINSYFENYIFHFDANFLFVKGDSNLRHHLNNFGMLNIFFLPLILLGVYRAVKTPKISTVLLVWLAVSVFPASLATPSPHAIRSYLMIIPLIAFSGIGFLSLFELKYKFPLIILSVFIFYSFFHFIYEYTTQYPVYSAFDWQYGFSDAAKYTKQLVGDRKFEKIYIDSRLEQAYIFWLFNLKYDPGSFQQNGSRDHFDKYYFTGTPAHQSEVLVSYANNFPEGYNILTTFDYPDGNHAVKIGYPK